MKKLLYLLIILINCSCAGTTEYIATSTTQINISARKDYYGYNYILGYINPNEQFTIYNKRDGKVLKVRYKNQIGYIFPQSNSEYSFNTTNTPIFLNKKLPKSTNTVPNKLATPEKTKTTSTFDPLYDGRVGFGFAYAPTMRYMNFELIYGINKNNFKLGMSFRPGNPRGKVVDVQLPNYGRTTDGTGSYFFSLDIGYGRIIKNHIQLDSELSFGGIYYYTNYIDRRFKDDGYHMITSSNTSIGLGINVGYSITKNLCIYTGYNTLRKSQVGVKLFFSTNN